MRLLMRILCNIYPNGNENPCLTLDPQFKLKGKNVVFVGIGGLACLRWIDSVILEKNLDNIPKLYVYDIGTGAQNLWALLQRIAAIAEDLGEFTAELRKFDFRSTHIEAEYITEIPPLFSIISGLKLLGNYPYFRAVIRKATIDGKDWTAPGAFDAISTAHPGAQIVVYASNIIEYVSYDNVYGPHYVLPVMTNILNIRPVYTIHSRSLLSEYNTDDKRALKPHVTLLLKGQHESPAGHIRMLQTNEYVPIRTTITFNGDTPVPERTVLQEDKLEAAKFISMMKMLTTLTAVMQNHTSLDRPSHSPTTTAPQITQAPRATAPTATPASSSKPNDKNDDLGWMKKGFLIGNL